MQEILIETQRLILRKLKIEDAERMFLLDSNPEVMKFVGQPVLTKPEQTQEVIKVIQKQYEENGIGRFAVIEKSTNLLIGWCGLKLLKEEINGFTNIHDLGYRFLPEYWGKGFAKEAGQACIQYAFNEMHLENLYAYADIQNHASHAVLLKLGFTQKNIFEDEGDRCYWYEMKSKPSQNNTSPKTQ